MSLLEDEPHYGKRASEWSIHRREQIVREEADGYIPELYSDGKQHLSLWNLAITLRKRISRSSS
jgi:hypothetical protein